MKKQNEIKWFKPMFAIIFVLGVGAVVWVFSSEPDKNNSEVKEESIANTISFESKETSEQKNILDRGCPDSYRNDFLCYLGRY